MGKNTLNSLMPLWLFVILKEKSSAQNPLSRNEIEKSLTTEYKVSIGEKDRNKTKRYINALCEYFKEQNCEGVIVETEKQVYYENAGLKTVSAWYLDSTKAPHIGGNFSVAEVNLLTDMVRCVNELLSVIMQKKAFQPVKPRRFIFTAECFFPRICIAHDFFFRRITVAEKHERMPFIATSQQNVFKTILVVAVVRIHFKMSCHHHNRATKALSRCHQKLEHFIYKVFFCPRD